MVNIPKERNTFCKGKDCRKHTPHKVTIYKQGAKRKYALGQRRYDRKQKGYGGQTKPIFHKKAKTTKKTTLRFECTKCGTRALVPIRRCKKIELGAEKRKGKKKEPVGAWK